MIALRSSLVLFLPAPGDPSLPGGPFHIGISCQACVETPLPEVHPPRDPFPDLPGPADAQRLWENDIGKEKESFGVPDPVKYPLIFHSQDGREAAPQCSCGRDVPASQLSG